MAMAKETAGVTSVRKFLFETDFDAPPVKGPVGASGSAAPAARVKAKAAPVKEPPAPVEPPPPPPPPEPTFSEAEVKAAADKARKDGQAAGEAMGRDAARAEIEQRIATALDAVMAQVTALQAQFATDRQAVLADATALAMAIVRKMLPEFSRRGGLVEIEAVIDRCLRDQRREPRLVVRVAPDLLPALEPRMAGLSASAAFEGRLFLIADARLGGADCTVEWTDGGMERHADAIWADISAALDRCLGLQGIEPSAAPDAAPVADTKERAAEAGADENIDTATDAETADAKNIDAGSLAPASDAEAMRSE
jgi:flagellar assembly protein FliH